MKKLFLALALLLVPIGAAAQAVSGTCTVTASGGTCKNIANSVGGMNAAFEEIPSGSPATVSVTIQGCMRGGTCDTAADTNTSISAVVRGVAFTKVYNYFLVTASWTGGTNATIAVNYVVTIAKSGSGGGAVASIFGRTGAVVAAGGDYTCAQVTGCVAGSTFQVDAVNLTSQTTVNFQDSTAFNGLTFVFTNPSAGNVKAGFSGTLGPGGIGTLVAGSNGLATSATTDTTNAANISSGLLGLARGGLNLDLTATGGLNQFLKQNTTGGAITVARPACGALSDSVASCSVDATVASNISSGTLPTARMPALTGDTTSSVNTVATTVVKINGTLLSGLATGILKNTTGTGVPSIAIGSDLPTAIPIGSVGSAGLSGTSPVTISAAGAIGCATCFVNNGVNTGTAAVTVDLNASTVANAFRVPVAAGCTAGLDGVECYDSTNKNHHVRTNGADSFVAAYAAAPTTNFIPKAVVTTGNTILQSSALSDNGTTVTSSEGLAFSGAAGAATTISTSTTNASMHLAPNGTGQVLLDTDGAVGTPAVAFNSQAGFGFARQAAGTFAFTNGSNFYMLLKSLTGLVLPQNSSISWVNSSTDATNATTKACIDNPTVGASVLRISSNCGNTATPVAMTVIGMSSRSGTDTNIGGADIFYQPGAGTGTGLPSRLRFQAPADNTASGTGAQTQLDRLLLNGTKTLSNTTATATTVFTLASGVTNRAEGGIVHYNITVSDGTDWCSISGYVLYNLVAKAGTRTFGTSTPTETTAKSGSACTTLSTTWAFAAASDNFQVTPAFTGITPTTVKMRYSVFNNGEDTITSF